AIVSAGGSVYYKFISVNAVYALLPASRVVTIAQRIDVESISPNRLTVRTRSLVQSVSGSYESNGAGAVVTPGVDGTGVGIAFLDSGIMATHKAFLGAGGASRVKRSVDMMNDSDVALHGAKEWVGGFDYSKQLVPGSAGRATFESTINSTGVAPGASLYDVRVLDDQGLGNVADALEGIDWVIFHGREYGIRVLNVSLAADSTESYMTDPLCRAVRNAVAAGITVVVAAGNYGQDAQGNEVYGSISAPGNEPSVITVGSDNPHDTITRADDSVNFFSSRGPTRGGYLDAQGHFHPDNVLKPDLIAPGNHIVGALSTDVTGTLSSELAIEFPQLVQQTGLDTGLIQVS